MAQKRTAKLVVPYPPPAERGGGGPRSGGEGVWRCGLQALLAELSGGLQPSPPLRGYPSHGLWPGRGFYAAARFTAAETLWRNCSQAATRLEVNQLICTTRRGPS